jgi:3-oxoacyl-[acyl-carrier protein] reductase
LPARWPGDGVVQGAGTGRARRPSALALSNTAGIGLWAWAKTAAADLFDDNITVNLACPGTHDTERARHAGMPGDGPVGDPADFGKVLRFLCSEPARFVGGTALQVDGATTTTCLP